MPEQPEPIVNIQPAIAALTTWLGAAKIKSDSANSFNEFVRSLVNARGGKLVLQAPHGTTGKNNLLEMGYVSQSWLRMQSD